MAESKRKSSEGRSNQRMRGTNTGKKSRVGNQSIVCPGEGKWHNEALSEVVVPRHRPEAKGPQCFAVSKR